MFLRVYNEVDIDEVAKHLIIIGDLMAHCSNCNQVGLDISLNACPQCKTEFKYAAFISDKDKASQYVKMRDKLKGKIFIDYADFKKCLGEIKAKSFFK